MWVTSSSFTKLWGGSLGSHLSCKSLSSTSESRRSGTVVHLVSGTIFPPRQCVWCWRGSTQALLFMHCSARALLLHEALLPDRMIPWDNIFRFNKKSPQPQLKRWDSLFFYINLRGDDWRASPCEVSNNFFPAQKTSEKSSKTNWSTYYLRRHRPLPVGNEKLQKV